MPDLIVSPTVQTLTVTETSQSLTVDALPDLTINQTIPISYGNAVLTSNVSVQSSQFSTITSLNLTAGTWMIWGEVEFYHTVAFVAAARISDLLGTNVYCGAEGTVRAAGYSLHLSISGTVTLASADTVYLMGKADSIITARAATNVNGIAGCTSLKAFKLSA